MGRMVVGSRLERHLVDLEARQPRLLSGSCWSPPLAGTGAAGVVGSCLVLAVEALAMQLFDLASLLQLLQELIALFLEFVFNFRRGPLQVLDVCQLFFIVYWPDKRVALPHFEETRDHLSDVVLLEGVGGDGLEHRLQALFHVVVRRLVLLRNVVVEIAKAPEEVRPCELLLLSRIASASLRDLCLMLGI